MSGITGRLAAVGIGVVLAAAAGGLARAEPAVPPPADEPTAAEERAFTAAVARVADAVVRIEPVGGVAAATPPGEPAPGAAPSTGVVVDATGDVVTTSFAVPAEADAAVVVRPDGSRLAARVIGRDRARGLVLLRCPPLADAPALEPAPRDALRSGQWTIAVGRGWTHARPAVAVGILSAVERAWGRGVQTDAAVSPVNYGGPLVDVRGRVIGILAPLPAAAGLPRGTELYDSGIGFAVPLEDVLRSVARMQRGEAPAPGILGIDWRGGDPVNDPPVIESCRRGSPAKQAGLRAGDTVVAVDGRAAARIADVRHAVGRKEAGDDVELAVERADARMAVRMRLVESLPPWRRAILGVRAADAGDDAAGVRVAWVLPGGPADAAGLAAGDVITAIGIDGEPARQIADAAALAAALAEYEPGDRVTLARRRGGDVADVAVITSVAPADLPDAAPAAGGDGGVTVVALAAPEVAAPPLAVLPEGDAQPAGVLVWCPPPRGAVVAADAEPWRAAAARHRVAVILPGSSDPRRWGPDDVAGIVRALASLRARQPVDSGSVALAGSAAGAGIAWLVAERLDLAVAGIAVLQAPLPRQAVVPEAAPGRCPWVLLTAGGPADLARRVDADRRRLEAAGFTVGLAAAPVADGPPADLLCRWAALVSLL